MLTEWGGTKAPLHTKSGSILETPCHLGLGSVFCCFELVSRVWKINLLASAGLGEMSGDPQQTSDGMRLIDRIGNQTYKRILESKKNSNKEIYFLLHLFRTCQSIHYASL